jgi:hypothetical protein
MRSSKESRRLGKLTSLGWSQNVPKVRILRQQEDARVVVGVEGQMHSAQCRFAHFDSLCATCALSRRSPCLSAPQLLQRSTKLASSHSMTWQQSFFFFLIGVVHLAERPRQTAPIEKLLLPDFFPRLLVLVHLCCSQLSQVTTEQQCP